MPFFKLGTSLGLASGITGGAAAITDKILKSRQLKEVEAALLLDQEATKDLEEKVYELQV